MKKAVRVLMWAHYIYLLLLPTLAVASAQIMFRDSDFSQTLLILGFPPVLIFTLFLANGYALPDSLPIALIVTLAIPAQIATSVLLFGNGSVWLFFAESAAVEINSFLVGTLFSAFFMRRNEFGAIGLIIPVAIALVMFSGGVASYILLVFYGYGGFSPWLILFITSFAVAFWEYAKVYKNVVEIGRKKRTEEHIEMKFDGGFMAKIFGIESDVPMISPFRHHSQKSEMTKPILIFGFTAMFLPLVFGMILELVL